VLVAGVVSLAVAAYAPEVRRAAKANIAVTDLIFFMVRTPW
jgi:hypothetical protein